MNKNKEKTIGQIVADDYRVASVFEKYGIDFCCKGNRTVSEVCNQNRIHENDILNEIKLIQSAKENRTPDFNSWPLDLLADYIEKKHHRYVESKIPEIQQYLKKLCQAHGKQHPELFEISKWFNQSAEDLTSHMKKEELMLFPYLRKMTAAYMAKTSVTVPLFGTVQNPVKMMMLEHDTEGDRFRTIAKLSNNYTPPGDACNTYKVAFALLKEFEEDLHLHIHLENNILFPKSIELESSFNNGAINYSGLI